MSEFFDIEEATIASIHAAVREQRLTFVELVQLYLDRIETFDKPSGLNSIIMINPNALKLAMEADNLFKATGELMPLAGIPLVLKDNFHTSGLPTTVGSVVLKDFVPPDHAQSFQSSSYTRCWWDYSLQIKLSRMGFSLGTVG
jgi:Asp-tRNA(Asn)/Glu-tRNA(Gln) amidotransferase A subunit family amidase